MEWMDLLRTPDFKLPITSLEVLHACLKVPPGGEQKFRSQNPHAFATFRDPSFVDKFVEEERKWIFESEHIHESDPKAAGKQKHQYIVWKNAQTFNTVVRDFKEMDRSLREAKHSCVCIDYQVCEPRHKMAPV